MIQNLGKGKTKLIVDVGRAENRKRKTKVVYYQKKSELRQLYAEFEKEVKINAPLSDITVTELVSRYIAKKKMVGLKATTEQGYKTAENRLNLRFERVLAKDLTTYQLENFVAEMANKSPKPYSSKTIRNTINLLSAAYEDAIRTGRLSENPCRNVLLPRNQKKEIITFSEAEVLLFLQKLEDERLDYKVGYKLCLLCGMRRSEVLGLRESDVDLVNKSVSISHTRHRVDGQLIEQDTKTDKSRRILALPDTLVDDIAELMREHNVFIWDRCDYLIQDGFGQPINPSTFTNQIFKIEDGCGLPKVSVHGLRHTFATMLNSEGIDIARISAELGHSSINTTLGIYTHVFGGASASSRGIADSLNKRLEKTATLMPPKAIKNA